MDVDIDLSSIRKHQILALLTEEFATMGQVAAQVATFGTEKSKSSIITACSGLEYEAEVGLFLASLIPIDRGFPRPLQDTIDTVPQFVKAMEEYPDILQVALSIEGLISSMGQHAAAVVFINAEELHNTTALVKTPKGGMCVAYNLHDADHLGLVKYDLLNTNAIDSIQANMMLLCEYGYLEWQGNLKDTYDKYLHPSVLEYEDVRMWELVNNKEILGLFQLKSS